MSATAAREALLRIFDMAEDRPDIRDVARAALAALPDDGRETYPPGWYSAEVTGGHGSTVHGEPVRPLPDDGREGLGVEQRRAVVKSYRDFAEIGMSERDDIMQEDFEDIAATLSKAGVRLIPADKP